MINKNNKQKLAVINPDAAGIDVGSREHYVCVPEDKDEENVRKFAAFTSDIKEMVSWLKKCGVKTIAMESTGVYYDTVGVELTIVPGLGELSVQTIISEVGLDMGKWKSEKHFTSWLGLSPNNKITGGKVFDTRTKKVNNRASTAFRIAALNIGKGKSALAGFYRRIKSKSGAPKAITATARKLACMFYRLLRYGQDYVECGIEAYEKKYNETMVINLRKQATRLGFEVIKVRPLTDGVC